MTGPYQSLPVKRLNQPQLGSRPITNGFTITEVNPEDSWFGNPSKQEIPEEYAKARTLVSFVFVTYMGLPLLALPLTAVK